MHERYIISETLPSSNQIKSKFKRLREYVGQNVVYFKSIEETEE